MRRGTSSWVLSVLAGILVGGVGGMLALQAIGSAPPPSLSRAEAGPSRPAASGGRTEEPATVPIEEIRRELREAVNLALAEGRRTAIVEAVARVEESVVTVLVTEERTRSTFFSFFGARPETYEAKGLGSGVIASQDGYVLTNEHVVGRANSITVRFSDGREVAGVVVDTDPTRDLAVLKIDPTDDLVPARFGSSEEILVGEWVIAIGSPYGFELEGPQPSVSVGVVSAVGRSFVTQSEGQPHYFPSTIQTDAAINPGNSGGPLVNVLGQVIGINSFILSEQGSSVGIGFAIPIDYVVQALEQIREFGQFRHAWTGINADDNGIYYVSRGLPNRQGAVILKVDVGSPAESAGLKPGDLILSANRRTVLGSRSLETVLVQTEIGDTLTLEYIPFGEERSRTVRLAIAERPSRRP